MVKHLEFSFWGIGETTDSGLDGELLGREGSPIPFRDHDFVVT